MTSDAAALPINHWARAERSGLCDLFLEVGPDAPTLCEGWHARDLAAHLVVREGRIDAAAGITVPAFAGWTKKVQDKAAAAPWPQLVDKVRNGPPRTSMMRLEKVDGIANTLEFFIHHEDVRRAQPAWEPRQLDPRLDETLWARLGSFAPRLMKSSTVGIAFATPDGRRVTVKEGPDTVTVVGEVGELTLFAYGRKEVRVEFQGSDAGIAALKSGSFGI
jgi:uncharacterized protein (TIGR03085 family)